MIDFQNYGPIQMDVLSEIGNIGIGNAATSLSKLVNDRIDMTVPKACFLPYEEIIALVGGPEEIVGCIVLRLEGDVPGTIIYIFHQESMFSLVDMLLGLELGTTNELDEMAESVVMEIGNILTGSFISAISMMSQLHMVTTVPLFAYDMLAAVLMTSLIDTGYIEDQVLLIETKLSQKDKEIKGNFFLFTDPGALEKVFMSLGISMEI
ncbi:CheC, inhibitor of MCP methylation [Desulfofarcimen acetoxidans DSM 771]|jgi:chemotaxis protein CheC|uniref:CheC, inhibitor of MCP methylation n=1 Tax=Desulfofarcimen acetoxidans (strain ATCC 49208 / DSM 771 / KCTC 5769 / VKM B-1644 / 5575) TaxID=485916 RepID=C8W1I3_DESAS|nr:chemotaxis protein CheC [Desulfofarcimen acetoxidans]ACV61628.1 CheC, inhibitor of MCP methylation [Desulfofarcimen acetoxidans DSM 771]